MEEAVLERIANVVPATVIEVCRRLRDNGHRAFTVGGAVRDAILGRNPGDWDITTSALPDQVAKLFVKTIPTGLEHGTITVMAGRGRERMAIEVTTFRGEGAYTDSRRPDTVTFGVSLEEDLARRDFVVNALAFDPIDGVLEDPFGGLADIETGRLRAVGDAAERFTEDGLRIMRAIRFVSVLDLELDKATEDALTIALPSLGKVAAERVRVELLKLLGGPAAMRALEIGHRHHVFATAVPILAEIEWPSAPDRCLALPPDPVLRLAGLVFDLEAAAIEQAMRRLTLSNSERTRVVAICRIARPVTDAEGAELRAILGSATRVRAPDLSAMWRADGRAALADRADAILSTGDALVARDLVIGGKDVMEILGIGPSRAIGEILAKALAAVHRDPSLNDKERLTDFVRSLD